MSTQNSRALTDSVQVVGRTPSFAERFAERFTLPNQEEMKRMKRAVAAGLTWGASDEQITKAEGKLPPTDFEVFSLAEYAQIKANTYGAPMPTQVAGHISAVQKRFPGAEARIHAHPKDDPFVEFTLGGESVFTMAWMRVGGVVRTIFPSAA